MAVSRQVKEYTQYKSNELWELSKLITVIIPTKNRPVQLRRALTHFYGERFKGTVLIGDAGDGKGNEHLEFDFEFPNIEYFRAPEFSIHATVNLLIPHVKTKYVTLMGDDDFFTLKGLASCADFLEKNKEYIGANGDGAMVITRENCSYGKIMDVGPYPLHGCEDDDPSVRLQKHQDNYSVLLFSLFRKNAWEEMWCHKEMVDVHLSAEIYPNMMAAQLGKIKHLKTLYLVRQPNHQQKKTAPRFGKFLRDKFREMRVNHYFRKEDFLPIYDLITYGEPHPCHRCNGTGSIEDKNGYIACPHCEGA